MRSGLGEARSHQPERASSEYAKPEWRVARLADVAEFRLGKMLDGRKNKGYPRPYLANLNVRWGRFDLDDLREMRFEEHEIEKYGLRDGDIVMCEGGEPGRCALWKEQLPSMTLQKALHRIRPYACMSNQFLYYNLFYRGRAGRFAPLFTGATIKHLPRQQLAKVEVDVPPMAVQERIVDILSAYDDLIENNRRRIALLEQAARELYREWFVRLRFPGHESTRIVDGLPEGWERKKIADVCLTTGGGTPSTKRAEYWDGDITWVVPTDVTNNDCLVLLDSVRKITEEGLRESSAKMVPAETILMTSRASVGFFAMMDREACTNQGFINVAPHDEEIRLYVLFNLINRVPEIRSNAQGATYPEISKGRFREMDVVIPKRAVATEFSRTASEVIDQLRCLKRSTSALTQARDIHLPRLMSREVAV